uniref:Dynein light intermediate chain n=2 Tax=Echinococcus granulosus TaxID=6210 RepID=A0A068WWD6_ECHGR|nr:Dynein intermediate chain [Echinococcus granulosus]
MGIEVEVNEPEKSEDYAHLWSSILKEVASARIGKLPHNKGIVVLGDCRTGKSTLACRLSHKNLPPRSPALEYHFVDIRDEATDDQTKLGVWILDGDLEFIPYLKFPLDKKNFANRMVMIVVDMGRPWKIMEELEKWAIALENYIKSMGIEVEEMQEYKDSLVRHFREYIEPDSILLHTMSSSSGGTGVVTGAGDAPSPVVPVSRPAAVAATGGNPLHPATAALLKLSGLSQQQQNQSVLQDEVEEGDEDNVDELEGEEGEKSKMKRSKKTVSDVLKELPITPGALINNLGIPLVVVVTKTDVMNELEREQGVTEEQFDIIQMHIRRFCLSYGAALVYVSAKNGKNCGLLKNYLQHRIYGFPFTQNAYVIDKDSVFIPAGWDSLNKISLLEQNLTKYRPGDDFEKVVPKPQEETKTTNKEPAETALDDQYFLSEIFTDLQRHNAATGGAGENGTESHEQASVLDVAGTPPSRPSSGSASRSRSSGAGVGGGLSGSSSERVLATFFNNLLSKSPSSRQTPNGPPASSFAPAPAETSGFGDTSSMSAREMQSELERLARTSKEALDDSPGAGEKTVTTDKSS